MCDARKWWRNMAERPETQEKRKVILRAATEVFGEKGATKGTLEDIAEKVGMTRAGVLHHFGSKDNLLLQTVIYRDSVDLEDYPEDMARGGMPEDGAITFRHLIKPAKANEARPGLVKAFIAFCADSIREDSPAYDYFVSRYRNLRRMLEKALRIMADELGKSVDDATICNTAMSILAVMDGLQIQWMLDPDAIGLAEETERAIKLMLAGALDLNDEERDAIL